MAHQSIAFRWKVLKPNLRLMLWNSGFDTLVAVYTSLSSPVSFSSDVNNFWWQVKYCSFGFHKLSNCSRVPVEIIFLDIISFILVNIETQSAFDVMEFRI